MPVYQQPYSNCCIIVLVVNKSDYGCKGVTVKVRRSILTAWRMKLLLSLVEEARRLRYLLPDGSRLKRPCEGRAEGRVESLTMLIALQVLYMSRRAEQLPDQLIRILLVVPC